MGGWGTGGEGDIFRVAGGVVRGVLEWLRSGGWLLFCAMAVGVALIVSLAVLAPETPLVVFVGLGLVLGWWAAWLSHRWYG